MAVEHLSVSDNSEYEIYQENGYLHRFYYRFHLNTLQLAWLASYVYQIQVECCKELF
jgi:hypothetical protein